MPYLFRVLNLMRIVCILRMMKWEQWWPRRKDFIEWKHIVKVPWKRQELLRIGTLFFSIQPWMQVRLDRTISPRSSVSGSIHDLTPNRTMRIWLFSHSKCSSQWTLSGVLSPFLALSCEFNCSSGQMSRIHSLWKVDMELPCWSINFTCPLDMNSLTQYKQLMSFECTLLWPKICLLHITWYLDGRLWMRLKLPSCFEHYFLFAGLNCALRIQKLFKLHLDSWYDMYDVNDICSCACFFEVPVPLSA